MAFEIVYCQSEGLKDNFFIIFQYFWSLSALLQVQLIVRKTMDLGYLAIIIPGAYILISILFLCFPNILHKKKRYQHQPFNQLIDSNKIMCIGHRGGAFQGPENTLELFGLTSPQSHAFQLDVCITKDNHLVVHHDTNLKRTCGVNKNINELNYLQLPKFMNQYESFGGGPIKTSNNAIPLLDKLFQAFPQMPMNIQLKTPTDQAIDQFDRLVRKYKRQHITIWGAMNNERNTKLREKNPEVVNFYSIFESFRIFLLCITGLLPFACIRQGVLDIPLITDSFKRIGSNFTTSNCQKCIFCFVILLLKFFNLISRLFVPHLKKRGILTFFWIVNAEQDFQTAISIGCQGIMTDDVSMLARYLKSTSLFFERTSDSF